jgi:hypothetical protein
VAYGLNRLSHLTLGECARKHIDAARYEMWRRAFFPAPAASAAAAPQKAPRTARPTPSSASDPDGQTGPDKRPKSADAANGLGEVLTGLAAGIGTSKNAVPTWITALSKLAPKATAAGLAAVGVGPPTRHSV